jgi:hypothetical protein
MRPLREQAFWAVMRAGAQGAERLEAKKCAAEKLVVERSGHEESECKNTAVELPSSQATAAAMSDAGLVALGAWLHGYFGLLEKSSKPRRRRAHSLVVFGPQRSTERH